MIELEIEKVKVKNETIKNVFAFVALQNAASDYLDYSEEYIFELFETQLNTKYKGKFSTNRVIRKKQEKLYNKELSDFKRSFKNYKKKIGQIYSTFSGINFDDAHPIEQELVGGVHEFVDKFISYAGKRTTEET